METQGTFILSFLSLVVFSFIIWIIALIHAATNKNFKDSNSKLIWVLIIIFTHVVGAILYLLFGRPRSETREQILKQPSLSFSIGEAIAYGWTTTKNNIWFFAKVSLIVTLISYLPTWLDKTIGENPSIVITIFSFFYNIISFVLLVVVEIGLTRIALNFIYDKKSELSDLFSSYSLFVKYLGASVLYLLLAAVGLILLIIPGIIWSIKYLFYNYFIVDKGVGPIVSLKKSAAITRGVKLRLSPLVLLVFGVFALSFGVGFLPDGMELIGPVASLIMGILLTPTLLLATAFAYRKLLSQNPE